MNIRFDYRGASIELRHRAYDPADDARSWEYEIAVTMGEDNAIVIPLSYEEMAELNVAISFMVQNYMSHRGVAINAFGSSSLGHRRLLSPEDEAPVQVGPPQRTRDPY